MASRGEVAAGHGVHDGGIRAGHSEGHPSKAPDKQVMVQTHSDLRLARERKGQREVTAAGTRASLQNHLATQHRRTGHNMTQSSKEKERAPNHTDFRTELKAAAPGSPSTDTGQLVGV